MYGADPLQAPREIDLVVSLYEEFPLGQGLGIQLITNVLIECKYRENLEVFAFDGAHEPDVAYPVYTDLVGSDFAISLRPSIPDGLSPRASGFAALRIKDHITPQGIIEEDFIYNAAASLYDYLTAHFLGLDEQDDHGHDRGSLWRIPQ